uniref:nucleotidyltransferase family protein n=1 Tax=uncultured Bacteroides sp. TaxID=162156 RepID=UPI00280B8F72|nr:nucleotidyltransferase family protein [uncultured Bacteroides sp.]
MEVIILAGGFGTRLRSVVSEVPKCMAPVGEKPFLWYLLKYLTHYDVSRVILSVGYLREIIYKWIDEVRGEFPFEFDYAVEEVPLGTGGGIRLALQKAEEEELVILNGDTFFDVDLAELMVEHKRMDGHLTIALKLMKKIDRYGTVDLSSDGHIITFHEKSYCKEGLINGGVYVINKRKLSLCDQPEKFSFEIAIVKKLCELGTLYGVVFDGYFKDIGIPEDYKQANEDFKALF